MSSADANVYLLVTIHLPLKKTLAVASVNLAGGAAPASFPFASEGIGEIVPAWRLLGALLYLPSSAWSAPT